MPRLTRFFSASNFSTLACSSWPTCTTSLGWRTRRQAMSVMCSRPSMPPRSTKAPYSVMFLTTPLTMAPSVSVSSSLARSSPIEASTTARRDNTTLLRLRSSLMTLNSMVLPSNGLMSLTGRVSSRLPGRKARMPLTSTVRPPLTLPLTVPVTKSPDSSAFSSDIHDARRLALSRAEDGVAVAVLDRVDGHRRRSRRPGPRPRPGRS
jgi:hypothetical protein